MYVGERGVSQMKAIDALSILIFAGLCRYWHWRTGRHPFMVAERRVPLSGWN